MAWIRRRRHCLAMALLGAASTLSPTLQAQTPAPAALTTAPASVVPGVNVVTLKVRVKGSGAPIANAEVTTPNRNKQFTNKQGELIWAIPNEDGQIKIYRAGQETEILEISALRGKKQVDIFMLPAIAADNEVIVRGERRPEASRKTITIAEAVKVAPGGDPAQVPKLLPGVQSRSFSPDIVVRGSAPEDSLYRVDNYDMPFIFHRIGNLSVVPPQMLADVEFSTGGFGGQYGNVTGGVVVLHTRSDVPETPKFEFKVNIPFYSALYYETPVNHGKDLLAASVRRSYLEAFLPLILKKNDADLTVVPFFGDEHLFYFHPTDDGHLKILATHAYDGLHLLFPSDAATSPSGKAKFDFKTSFELIGVEWKKSLDNNWTMILAPNLFNNDNSIDVIDNTIDIKVRGLVAHADFTRKLDGKNRLYLGGELGSGLADIYVVAPVVNNDDPFFDPASAPKLTVSERVIYSSATGWVATDRYIGDLMFTPGLRPFYYSQVKKSGYDPRLNWRYQLSKDHALKGAIGQYSETPQFQDVDKVFGNPDLKYIRSTHYILGLETAWTDRWLSDVQVFYKEINGLVRSDPVTVKNNDGRLISSGFEFFIRRNVTERLFGWVAYTYSRNRERDKPGSRYRNGQYDQTNVLNLVGNYKITPIWDLGGRFVYHTGDTYTGVDHSVYDANLDKYQARSGLNTQPYNKRLPSYHELDIYAERDILYDTSKLTWRMGIEYLALQRQAQGVQYNYDYTKTTYFRGIPPIPYIELRGTI